jgi:[ribosomal protein S5]-alanine N-acetyltransferase
MFKYKEYILRKPIKKDTTGFYKISHDKKVNKYYGTMGTNFKDINEAEKQVKWCIDQFNNNAGRWIIITESDNNYIGDIGFHDYVNNHNRVEFGYRLFSEYWNKGIITNFTKQLVEWGFNDLKYNRIEAVDVRNEASKKVLLKNNFILEGTLRQYEFENNGYVDLEMYSLLKDDFYH